MALPKKKSRMIVVNGEAWYWRTISGIRMDAESALKFEEAKRLAVEKNPELKKKKNFGLMFSAGDLKYVHTANLIIQRQRKPDFMIKACFEGHKFILPKIVSAVISYAVKHSEPGMKIIELTKATAMFQKEFTESQQKENDLYWLRHAKYNQITSNEYELSADQHINKGEFYEAINKLRSSISYDKENSYKQNKLDRLINESNASARLYNKRAVAYYELQKYKKLFGNFSKALADAEKAIQLDPGYALAYGTLAEILYREGDAEGFYQNLEMALEKGMTVKIDDDIGFELRRDSRYLNVLEHYGKMDWIQHYWKD